MALLTDEEVKAFLLELRELSLKHGIIIGGCGCCSSPWMAKAQAEELGEQSGYGHTQGGDLEWIGPMNPNPDKLVKPE